MVRLRLLRYLIVTHDFHHWHHTQYKEALDRTYAARFAFIDYLFSAAVNTQRKWPKRHGVLGDYVPREFVEPAWLPVCRTRFSAATALLWSRSEAGRGSSGIFGLEATPVLEFGFLFGSVLQRQTLNINPELPSFLSTRG